MGEIQIQEMPFNNQQVNVVCKLKIQLKPLFILFYNCFCKSVWIMKSDLKKRMNHRIIVPRKEKYVSSSIY